MSTWDSSLSARKKLSMPTLRSGSTISPRLLAFLEWLLQTAQPEELCSPPGLGGLWRARHIRSALDQGVLVVHNSDQGLAFVIPSSHGVCRECALTKGSRTICEHCQCVLCRWERETQERNSPRVSREKFHELSLRLQAFSLGAGPRSAAPASLVD